MDKILIDKNCIQGLKKIVYLKAILEDNHK